MSCRTYGSKSTLGFWLLVLAADAAFVAAGVGLPVILLLLAFAALVVGGVVAARRLTEPTEPATQLITRRRL